MDDFDFDFDVGGAFDMGGMGDVDFSDTGAFDLGGLEGILDFSNTGAFDLGGLEGLIDFSDTGAFDLGGLEGLIDFSDTGAFDLGGMGNLFDFSDTGAFDLGGASGAFDIFGGGAFDQGGLEGLLDLSSTGAFDLGGAEGAFEIAGGSPFDQMGLSNLLDLSSTGAFDLGGAEGAFDIGTGGGFDIGGAGGAFDIGTGGGFDQTGFEGIDLQRAAERSPYQGLGYTDEEIRQLQEGTFAGQEQTEAQVKEQLGEELYNQLYPEGVDKLSSGSYTGLGYTAKEIAELMEGAAGVRDTDWTGEIKGTDVSGGGGGGGGGKDGKGGTDGKDGKTTDDKKKEDTKDLLQTIRDLFGGKDNAALMALLGGLLGLLGRKGAQTTGGGYQGGIPKYVATRGPARAPTEGGRRAGGAGIGSLTGGVSYTRAAQGGLMGLASGGAARPARYLRGGTDGMADKIQTNIEGKQPARLSHGEFVIPADVVSHLGNGNSDAGAKVLHDMMGKVRKARTGTKKQGKQINPRKYIPA